MSEISTGSSERQPVFYTRSEIGRSIEDKNRLSALKTLRELKLLIPLTDVETFHGRSGPADEKWQVNPRHGENSLGNINRRKTLYTSDRQTAEEFADARLQYNANQTQIHEIVSADPDATIIDKRFKPDNLSPEDLKRFDEAIKALTIPITEGSPVSFDDRESVKKFVEAVNKLQKIQGRYIVESDLDQIAQEAKIGKEVTRQLASSFNITQVASRNPMYLADRLLHHPSGIFTEKITINGKEEDVPINIEYIERYMRANHIVGVRQEVDSVTLDRGIISYSLFDLTKVGTKEQVEQQRQEMAQKMVALKDSFPPLPNPYSVEQGSDLLIALQNTHEKPEYLVEQAKKVGNYGKTYETDAGVWERFTLGEHTETVLRNFDENFADIVPSEYLVPMRLAMLVHDLGKPEAHESGDKSQQRIYNAIRARRFLETIHVDQKMAELIVSIITDGSDLAYKLQKQKDNHYAKIAMDMYSEDVLRRFLGKNNINNSEIIAFTEMCKIMQICDGGAYTSMGITRRLNRGQHRNAPSFNASFAEPIGLGKRDIQYKE